MPALCCTSDFTGDGLLNFEDYRIYYVWRGFVDREQPVENQKEDTETLYAALYPGDQAVTVTDLPELDCADYDGNGLLTFVDYRLYYVWRAFVNKEQSNEEQLTAMLSLYNALYPSDTLSEVVRFPTLLDPVFCEMEHGWFATPWHEHVVIHNEEYGWLE